MARLFAPTARQLNVIITLAFLALGYGLYLRYVVIEQASVSLACEGGAGTWLCWSRHLTIVLFKHGVFGLLAMAAACINLIRPQVVLFSFALFAAALGIVLYNLGASGSAIGLLILSLARPAPHQAEDDCEQPRA